MLKKIRLPFLTSLVLALLAAFSFQTNESSAAVYKSGYADFTTYFQTESFYLKAGTYSYTNTYYSKAGKSNTDYNLFYVDLYKGNKKIEYDWNCYKYAKNNKQSDGCGGFDVKTSGYYKLRFTKSKKHSSSNAPIHITKYSFFK
jgi:hypothetical protein